MTFLSQMMMYYMTLLIMAKISKELREIRKRKMSQLNNLVEK